MPGPLTGVRVLDLSRLFPGPYATLLLADLGADVVKIEEPNAGDYIRHYPPAVDDVGGAAFWALNRGKRSVALDLRSADDRSTFLDLVECADVVIESFRPGVLEKLNVGPDVLHARNPRLVVCRISGYGQDGPDRLRAGHDLNYAARAGVLGMAKTPSPLPVQVADLAGGAWPAAMQICAALYGREQTGQGAVIDVSMTDGAHAMLVMPHGRRAVVDDEPIGDGHDLLVGSVPCYDVYATKDGYLAVGALEPKFWAGFCGALGLDELASEGWTPGAAGVAVREKVQAKLDDKTTDEWDTFFRDFDVCVEPVRNPEDAHQTDPQLAARRLRVDVNTGTGVMSLPATPVRTSGAAAADSAAPLLGAHNAAVLQEWTKK